MDTELFFRTSDSLHKKIVNNLKKISLEKENVIEVSETSLMELDECIRKLKDTVSSFQFECLADEIHFFKNIKPLFISKFIFHAKILEIEASKPNASEWLLKKYYKFFLRDIKDFYRDNKNFINYINKDATHLDHTYFVRNKHDIKAGLSLNVYDFDESFTTSHDGILAKIWAYEELEIYLQQKINNSLSDIPSQKVFSLYWSSSKASLIELLYALYQTNCFNNGNIELSEIVRTAEITLNIKLGNFYKTIGEIRSRKNGRTKFLQLLNDNLNQLFLESDE